MGKSHEEWLRQADYDMGSAECLLQGGRTTHALFLCHLSLEKALKGLYQVKTGRTPPKVHDLVWLLREIGLKPPEDVGRPLVRLNEVSVSARYPLSIDEMLAQYPPERTGDLLNEGKRVLKWIVSQF